MPKDASISLRGIKFEDALKKLLATPRPAKVKKAKRKK
jgi:hypothetical protein